MANLMSRCPNKECGIAIVKRSGVSKGGGGERCVSLFDCNNSAPSSLQRSHTIAPIPRFALRSATL
jgi:hypothetical protein